MINTNNPPRTPPACMHNIGIRNTVQEVDHAHKPIMAPVIDVVPLVLLVSDTVAVVVEDDNSGLVMADDDAGGVGVYPSVPTNMCKINQVTYTAMTCSPQFHEGKLKASREHVYVPELSHMASHAVRGSVEQHDSRS